MRRGGKTERAAPRPPRNAPPPVSVLARGVVRRGAVSSAGIMSERVVRVRCIGVVYCVWCVCEVRRGGRVEGRLME